MPNYDTHSAVNYVAFIFISIISLINSYLNIIQLITLFIGVYLGTNYISPDIDIQSVPYKKLKVIWSPYNKISKQTKHRGTSHSITGIITRIIFITSIFILTVYASGQLKVLIDFISTTKPTYIYLFLSGIVLSNIIHILLDNFA